jgi:hypothetical protein
MMVEIEIPENYPHREGHLPDMQVVFLDLYRLLTIFLASRHLAELRTETNIDPITALQDPEMDEITRILISTAVIARIIDDRDNHFLSQQNTECGWLIKNLENPDENCDLTLREACNKIIHAKKIRTDLEVENHKSYLNPMMYFYGTHRDIEWKACLDIVEFVKKYYENLQHA